MTQLHIGGQRAAEFRRVVGGLDPERVLLVGVDVSKASWFALGCDLTGRVVIDGAKLIADRSGVEGLRELVEGARERIGAELVIVGIEAAGHLHQTLAAHVAEWPRVLVRLLNPAAVAAVRKEQLNRRRKTDWLDAAAICELLCRGEGCVSHLEDSAAAALRPLWAGRKDLVEARARLRQQAHALVDCLWPGMMARDDAAGVRPLFSSLFDVKAARVLLGLLGDGQTPADIAAAGVDGLRKLCAARGVRLTRPTARRIVTRAAGALPPHPAASVGKAATLAALLASIAALEGQIGALEAQMAELLPTTEGAKLTQIRGVDVVTAAGFVAFVGHADRWGEWSKVWRAAGLDPARSQSGPKDASFGISREGSAWGRRAILDLASSVCRQPGRWRDGYQRRVDARKPKKVALIAEGNRVGRTCFALMGSGADYDHDHEATRALATRKAGDRAA